MSIDPANAASDMKTARIRRSSATSTLLAAIALVTVVAADQITKNWAIRRLLDGPEDGPGPFRFRLMANRGAFMGLALPSWLLIGVVVVVIVMAARALARGTPRRAGLGWGLLAGGAIGNLLDRVQHRPRFPDHAVVDWIASSLLPTFNIADVAIVAGLLLLSVTSKDADGSQPMPAPATLPSPPNRTPSPSGRRVPPTHRTRTRRATGASILQRQSGDPTTSAVEDRHCGQ